MAGLNIHGIYRVRQRPQFVLCSAYTVKLWLEIIIIINITNWTLWCVPSPKLQLLCPTFLQSSNCSPFLWSVVVWFQRDSVLWHSLRMKASSRRLKTEGAHPYRKRACLEALRLATTKLTQRGTGYPSWGHFTQLRISRASTGLIYVWKGKKEEIIMFVLYCLSPCQWVGFT